MLSHEWGELEAVCERIADLRHRLAYAQRSQNAGLHQGLKNDLELAQRQREMLVQHISARLGHASADDAGGPAGGDAAGPDEHPDESGMTYGFPSSGSGRVR